MIAVAAVLTSASVHQSQAAIPLAAIGVQARHHLYDLMDAVYCGPLQCAHTVKAGAIAFGPIRD